MASLAWLSILHGIAGLVYMRIAISDMIRRKQIRIIHCVQVMYAFVYGFIPMIVFYREFLGQRNLIYSNYTGQGIFHLYFIFLVSTIAFSFLMIFYKVVFARGGDRRSCVGTIENQVPKNDKHILICGVVCLAVGWVSLYLWTMAYGSISAFIAEASMIRSGLSSVYNPLAFMKQFTRVLPISLYALLTAFLIRQPKGTTRIGYLLLIVAGLIGTWLYTLASDSRVQIGFTMIAVILIILKHRKKQNMKKYIFIVACLAVVALTATVFADPVTHYARYGVWQAPEKGIFDALIVEFRFIPSTQMKVMSAVQEGTLANKIADDFLLTITSWIPDRFIPFALPKSIWAYNTELVVGMNASGTVPSDLLTAGIYYFGLMGTIVYPAIFGALAGYVDRKLFRTTKSWYADPYYAGFACIFINAVSHNQFSAMVSAAFPLFLYFLVGCAVKLVYKYRN